MKDNYKSLLSDIVKNNLTKDKVIEELGLNPDKDSKRLYEMMHQASEGFKFDEVEILLSICQAFRLDNEEHVEELNRLLYSEGHQRHEDIAFALEQIKSPKSIDVLYETALKKFDYLAYNDSQALARKCIWGLGEIGTKESYAKLKVLANTDNDYIKATSIKQLKRRGIDVNKE